SDSEGSFASNHKIPSTNTKVATFTNNISLTGFSKISTTYAVGVIPYQAADTYTGQVKYTLVHPNFADSNQKVYMQDLTPTMIADLLPNVGNTFVAYDKRDNQSYKIAKLADGKYWMVENLNLAGGTTVTPDDSDVTGNYTLPVSNFEGFSDNTIAYVYNTDNETSNCVNGCYSYYSYVAATAGTSVNITSDGYNASSSICPKGWRLPTATTSNAPVESDNNWKTGDFYALATAYGANLESNYLDNSATTGTNFYNNAGPGTVPNFLLGGANNGTEIYVGGIDGLYWTSTSSSVDEAYYLNFRKTRIFSSQSYSRRYGYAVRCLFEDRDITDISTMQEISPAIAANTPVGTSTTLTDSRGGVTKSYTVAKLADNKVWMTTNLDLPGGTTITPADSDVTENFILPTSSTTGFSSDTEEKGYVYNSGNTTNCGASGQNTPCYSYYSYNAATAGTGASIDGDGVNATSSICPKGWMLPTATTEGVSRDSGGYTGGDFYQMILAETGQSSLADGYSESTANFYNNAGPGTTPGFLLAGNYLSSAFYNGGSYGRYWSSTSKSGTGAYNLFFTSSHVNSAGYDYRRLGCSVRCLAKS
ncbi:hypothetical protein IJJ39_00545, partial [Candidatus Saccharibacteria bacterium]|nr:hypothetical protein [Candidatus Saccharibacteria bacterium]